MQLPDSSLSSATAGVPAEDPTRGPLRFGLGVIALGLGGFLLWAALAPLDEGVPSRGTVVLESQRKTVQHLSGGLVREILVGEGQTVTAGQVLLRLDDAAGRAQYEARRQQYLGLLAMESRLLAEQTGAAAPVLPPELLTSDDPAVRRQVATQQSLFAARRGVLAAQRQGLREAERGQEALIAGYEARIGSLRRQEASLRQELAGIRELVEEGYAPLARRLDLERRIAGTEGDMAELTGQIARTRGAIGELRQRAAQLEQEYFREGDAQLAQIRLELQADRERYAAAGAELARSELRAPVAGQVVGLSVHTVGAVIQPAQKLMDIVPSDEALVLEARIPPQFIDRLTVGAVADVRFSAFAHAPMLVVEGRLESLSQDVLTETTPQGEIGYYLARVRLTPAGLRALGGRRLQAGMPAEVVIRTGERSLLAYLLQPLVKRVAASMKEE